MKGEKNKMRMPGNPNAQKNTIQTLDLNFMGKPSVIASYLVPHQHGAVLVETGPGSTIPALLEQLKRRSLHPGDITDVLLTHIHLDHGGAAGWFARQGATIHVHPAGAPHLVNPEKLLSSASRVYGDQMDVLWGEFLSVPAERISVPEDGDVIEIGELKFKAIDTPGHANHHYTYRFLDVLFTGDIGGVRLPGPRYIQLPMVPPEFHLEKWRLSLERLYQEDASRIAPTHYGIYPDIELHLSALRQNLADVEQWMEILNTRLSAAALDKQFYDWVQEQGRLAGVDPTGMDAYDTANPYWMSPVGMQRYWKKYRVAAQ